MADITPVTREEFYLAKAGGQDVPVPSAVTREEHYLEKLSNDSVVVPSPITRREKFLYFACGGEIDLPSEDRMTRLERLIAKAGGMDVSTPTAVTRLEKFWANVEGGWTVSTLTGTLPITFRSNGTALINYRVYGTANGSGERTKNLLEITTRATTKHEVTFTPDRINGTILATGQCNPPTTNQAQYEYAGGLKPIPDSFRQELILEDDGLIGGTQSAIAFYDDSEAYISGVVCDGTTKSKTVTISSNATKYKVFVRKTASAGDVDVTFKPMLRKADTTSDFIPYGYQIPLTVTNGTETKSSEIFIGVSKLMAGDYIDYESGKIIRNGTPQDPPLPFPKLETFNGENALDSTETLGEVTIKGKIKEA